MTGLAGWHHNTLSAPIPKGFGALPLASMHARMRAATRTHAHMPACAGPHLSMSTDAVMSIELAPLSRLVTGAMPQPQLTMASMGRCGYSRRACAGAQPTTQQPPADSKGKAP